MEISNQSSSFFSKSVAFHNVCKENLCKLIFYIKIFLKKDDLSNRKESSVVSDTNAPPPQPSFSVKVRKIHKEHKHNFWRHAGNRWQFSCHDDGGQQHALSAISCTCCRSISIKFLHYFLRFLLMRWMAIDLSIAFYFVNRGVLLFWCKHP